MTGFDDDYNDDEDDDDDDLDDDGGVREINMLCAQINTNQKDEMVSLDILKLTRLLY